MEFLKLEQGEKLKITKSIYSKYWQWGFKTRLYDVLTPQAYLDSLARVAHYCELKTGQVLLDAGCGSGSLIPFLAKNLKDGGRYLGMDILDSGFTELGKKAGRLGFGDRVESLYCDFSGELPLAENLVDVAVAHFSIYTLAELARRKQVYKNLFGVLKPGGRLITVNPSQDYDADKVIQQSLVQLKERVRPLRYWVSKSLLYPLTLRLGLRFIEKQLKTGAWHSYSLEEMVEDVRQAGFTVQASESVYAGSAWLVVAEK